MWRSSFLVNLQAFRLIAGNFTIKWTPSPVFFDSILSCPMLPSCFDLSAPPSNFEEPLPPMGAGVAQLPPPPTMFATPVENLELRANIRSWRAKNAPKLPSKYLKNHTIFELYTDDNTSKYSSNPKDLLKSAKIIMKLYTKWKCTATTTEAVSKISNIKKISNKHFNLSEAEISIDTFQMN